MYARTGRVLRKASCPRPRQIRKQARDRELEAGLAVILERKEQTPGYRSQVVEIVDRIEAGESVAQVAEELHVHPSTGKRRLADVHKYRPRLKSSPARVRFPDRMKVRGQDPR
jgi:hypothetical protein